MCCDFPYRHTLLNTNRFSTTFVSFLIAWSLSVAVGQTSLLIIIRLDWYHCFICGPSDHNDHVDQRLRWVPIYIHIYYVYSIYTHTGQNAQWNLGWGRILYYYVRSSRKSAVVRFCQSLMSVLNSRRRRRCTKVRHNNKILGTYIPSSKVIVKFVLKCVVWMSIHSICCH